MLGGTEQTFVERSDAVKDRSPQQHAVELDQADIFANESPLQIRRERTVDQPMPFGKTPFPGRSVDRGVASGAVDAAKRGVADADQRADEIGPGFISTIDQSAQPIRGEEDVVVRNHRKFRLHPPQSRIAGRIRRGVTPGVYDAEALSPRFSLDGAPSGARHARVDIQEIERRAGRFVEAV